MTSRRRIGKKTPSSRTAQLEEKLDDLVSILRATQSSSSAHPQPENATPSLSAYSASTAGQITSRLESLATAAATSSAESQSCHTYGTSSSSHNPIEPMMGGGNSDTILLPEPTPEEAEVYLDKFRDWLKSFPLMIIPYDMTAATLRKERPFLWLCIMNITSMSVPQQMKLKDRVREEAATRVIINHERSMDVLLGLITYVAWATMTSGPGTRPFIVTYCQLAITIVYELSLMRAPVEEQYFTICFKMWGGRPPPPRLRTMEERRAIVSLWFITSVVTSFVGKMDTLRWTSHMDDCLTVLERDREHPSDEVLVALVRYQLVADEAQKLLIRDVMGEASQAPTYVFRKSLLTKMQDIREGLSPNLPPNKVLQAHSFAIEAQVNSVGLFMQTIPVTQRIESMYSCLKAVRAWYDVFFAIPLEELPGAPFSLYVQMSQIQVALYRLTTSEDPAWDKDLVRNTADLLVLLDRIIDLFNQLDAIYHVRADLDDDTLFAKGAKIMRNIRTSWEPALSRHLGSTPSSSTPGVVNQQRSIPNSVQAAMNIPDANMLDFGDITWMSDVFGPTGPEGKSSEGGVMSQAMGVLAGGRDADRDSSGNSNSASPLRPSTPTIYDPRRPYQEALSPMNPAISCLDKMVETTIIPKSQSEPRVMTPEQEKFDAQSDAPTLHDPNEDTNKTNPENDTPKVDEEDEWVVGWKLASLMISITLAAFLMLLDMSIIVTAIPRITSDFHSLQDIGWYGSSYNLASAALQPLSGKLYTYFKSKPLFLGFLFIFELGCLICGLAQSSIMLIIGRTIAGIGGSGIQNGALTMIAASVPLNKRPSLVGLLMGGAQLGLVIGPLVGGAFTEYTTWRWCFYINLPIGAVCTVLMFLVHVPDRRVRTSHTAIQILTSKLDFTGFLIFAPCTVMFLLALQWGRYRLRLELGDNHRTLLWRRCSFAHLYLLGASSRRRRHDPSTSRSDETSLDSMPDAISIKEASPFTSGVNMLPSILPQLASAVLSGGLAQKVGYYLPFASLSAAISAIANGLLSTMSPHTSTAKWAGYQVLAGVGRGMGMQMPIIAVQAHTSAEVTSVATAVLVFSQVFGGAVFVSVANVIFNNKLHDELVSRLPHIDVDAVIDAGATGLRQVVSGEDLPQALEAYSEGVSATFLLAVGASCAMFISSFGIGWKDIRKKAPAKAGDA
ncbi:hypothetical protein NM208_g13944 [Fusarium decemcellulare]|uniref:Uncharacterized protein n=1 Tax=Fusarium decemcellulare TaxID=57161 RepID=A0ACC1RHW3_9HYPO|nr:hypothetical protein NM208_g13944 [Fusarium decemcellulare]